MSAFLYAPFDGGIVHPGQHGASGQGVNDDRLGWLNTVVNIANTRQVFRGIPGKTYRIATALTLTSSPQVYDLEGCRILVEAKITWANSPVVWIRGGVWVIDASLDGMNALEFNECDDVWVDYARIEGQAGDQPILDTIGVTDLRMHACQLENLHISHSQLLLYSAVDEVANVTHTPDGGGEFLEYGGATEVEDLPLTNLAALRALGVPASGVERHTLGFGAVNDGGHAEYWWNATDSRADDGWSIVQPDSLPATGRWNLKIDPSGIRVEQAGAVGSGAVTTEIQRAIDYVLANDGHLIFDGSKTYTIDAALTFGAMSGSIRENFTITGNKCIINQDTNNTPIFQFTAAQNVYPDWHIEGFICRWTNNQGNTDTEANCVQFDKQTSGLTDYANGAIRWIYNYNGYRTISAVGDLTDGCGFWGNAVEHIACGQLAKGALLYLASGAGQPNNKFTHLTNASAQGNEPVMYLENHNEFQMDNVEVLLNTKRILEMTTCRGFEIGVIRMEQATLADDEGILMTSCRGRLNSFTASSCEFPADGAMIRMQTVSFGTIAIGSLHARDCTAVGDNNFYALAGLGSTRLTMQQFPNFENSPEGMSWAIADAGLIAQLVVHDTNTAKVNSSDNGDANQTFVVDTDRGYQKFNTTLTANRVVSLSRTNAWNGAEFTIARLAATPGAFTLEIKNEDAATIYTIPASEKRIVTCVFEFNQWVLKNVTPAL